MEVEKRAGFPRVHVSEWRARVTRIGVRANKIERYRTLALPFCLYLSVIFLLAMFCFSVKAAVTIFRELNAAGRRGEGR